MAATTKMRRPVAMATPPPVARKAKFTVEQKQSVLDNFDLEVEDKLQAFHSQLAITLQTFLTRQETEIVKIPRELRNMTISQLEDCWGGNWGETIKKMRRDEIERREREEEARRREAAIEEEGRGKRKRGTGSVNDSPVRSTKNARPNTAPSSNSKASSSTPANTRKPTRPSRQKPTPSSKSSAKGPSTLPQDHIFNPVLPPTPSQPRLARATDHLLSANGSPIVNPLPPSPSSSSGSGATNEQESDSNSDSDLDLPDEHALEARMLAKSQSQSQHTRRPTIQATPRSKPSKPSRSKRAPSIMVRQSLAPGEGPVMDKGKSHRDDGLKLREFPLSDGRIVTFNPYILSPGRLDAEIDEGDFAIGEKETLKAKVREEALKALQEEMAKWKM